MTKENTLSRRGLLKLGGVSALAVGASRVLNADVCALTPPQDKGPFYPVADQADKNTDLTRVNGKRGKALGTVIYVAGKVTDQNCLPVEGVTVEIWQACQSGRYNHPRDPNRNGILDPNFQYWGIDVSKADGTYGFTTIVPGHYPAGANWTRPPHIHFKVHKLGIRELITQMYFLGNRYNDADLILNAIPANERASVVRPMVPRAGTDEFDVNFDISVHRFV
jgi:protocatechuate 3,4-dioxygenase beta subunit